MSSKTINNRTTEYEIEDIFLKRYSSRAMSGEALSKEELLTLLEAGRWAPSSMNAQPWRFIYAIKGTPFFEELFSFIMEKNKIWVQKAGVFVLVISKNNLDDGSFSVPHSFDTGAACENIALQAAEMDLVFHIMGGFDKKAAKEKLEISDDYTIEVMLAVGKKGAIEDLPEELREREKPSARKPLIEIVFEGKEGVNKLNNI